MTTAKEASRPSSQHRLSVGSPATSMPSRQSRTHSHSLSVGSLNSAHRVSRRKSMSSSAHNNAAAAMAAALKGTSLEGARRPSKASLRGSSGAHLIPGSLPNHGGNFGPSSYGGVGAKASPTAAITDGPPLSAMPEHEKGNSKARVRRASEGSRLSKEGGKRVATGDLRCEKCGKGYKHSSCLTKHLWEHTPEWALTSKLLISKHQQVQLLEAASVLVAMNHDETETVKDSDLSSPSPAASSSDAREGSVSSAETSPPPDVSGPFSARHSHRYSTASSAYSHSYQSGNSIFSESAPSHGMSSHFRQWSNDGRPQTSGTSVAGSNYDEEDQADLAAAVGLLSCSYGTPKSGPTALPPDVPPVPPLPARYLDQNREKLSASATTIMGAKPAFPGQRAYSNYRHESRDVRMGEDDSEDDLDRRRAPRGRVDEEDDGMFGRMEE